MFEADVLSQLQSLAALTKLDSSEFSHVNIGAGVTDIINAGGDYVLGSFQIDPRFALIVTSFLIGSCPLQVDPARGRATLTFQFLPFFNGFAHPTGELECNPFLRLDGQPLMLVDSIEPFAFASSCLVVVPPGLFTFGMTVTSLGGERTALVGRACGFLCPVEAAAVFRASRTQYFGSIT